MNNLMLLFGNKILCHWKLKNSSWKLTILYLSSFPLHPATSYFYSGRPNDLRVISRINLLCDDNYLLLLL